MQAPNFKNSDGYDFVNSQVNVYFRHVPQFHRLGQFWLDYCIGEWKCNNSRLVMSMILRPSDSFNIRYLSVYTLQNDLESIFLANLSGALKVTKEETRGSPTIDELTEFRNSVKKIEYRKLL